MLDWITSHDHVSFQAFRKQHVIKQFSLAQRFLWSSLGLNPGSPPLWFCIRGLTCSPIQASYSKSLCSSDSYYRQCTRVLQVRYKAQATPPPRTISMVAKMASPRFVIIFVACTMDMVDTLVLVFILLHIIHSSSWGYLNKCFSTIDYRMIGPTNQSILRITSYGLTLIPLGLQAGSHQREPLVLPHRPISSAFSRL